MRILASYLNIFKLNDWLLPDSLRRKEQGGVTSMILCLTVNTLLKSFKRILI